MRAFIVCMAFAVGFVLAVVLTFLVADRLSRWSKDPVAGQAYFWNAMALSVLTGPLGGGLLGWLVHRFN